MIATRLSLDAMVALLTGPGRELAAAVGPGMARPGPGNRAKPALSSVARGHEGPRQPLRQPVQVAAGGRGCAYRVELAGGRVVWVRKYLRGGFMRYLVRDLYLLRPPRPLRELVVTEAARAAGCRVPTVHAVCIEEAGPCYRGWIVTSAIEPAEAFIERYLRASEERRELMSAAGAAIAGLHRAGVYHVDLTGHNLLIDDAGEVHVIDFDRAVHRELPSPKLAESGLRRFMRSMAKLCASRQDELHADARQWLDAGYRR